MDKIIKNHNHWEAFSERAHRLISEQVLCDVTLISQERRFSVNRFLLSAWSEYFTFIFTGMGNERPEIKIENVNAEDLRALIDFCSTGKLEVNSVNAETLLRSANTLQITTATSICWEYIFENLSLANCLKFWRLAKHLNMNEWECKVLSYCLEHFDDIPTSKFMALTYDELDEILKNDGNAFQIIMEWIRSQPCTRIKHTSALPSRINFKLVRQSDFTKYIDFLRQYVEAHEFLIDTMKFYLLLTDERDVNPTQAILNAPRICQLMPSQIFPSPSNLCMNYK